jgi:hypothetical protein
MQNRDTAKKLEWDSNICPECGQRGLHWVEVPITLDDAINWDKHHTGFWTCDKFYGPDGRRLT